MKLVVLKNNLKEGLSIVEKAAGENSNLPILKNVLIKTFNNKIQLSSTNLEFSPRYLSRIVLLGLELFTKILSILALEYFSISPTKSVKLKPYVAPLVKRLQI